MSSQDEDYVYEVRVQTPSCMAFIPDLFFRCGYTGRQTPQKTLE